MTLSASSIPSPGCGSARHALVIETHLRPLFSFFNVVSAPAGVFATETDFNGYDDTRDSLSARIDEAIGQFARLLPASRAEVPLGKIA